MTRSSRPGLDRCIFGTAEIRRTRSSRAAWSEVTHYWVSRLCVLGPEGWTRACLACGVGIRTVDRRRRGPALRPIYRVLGLCHDFAPTTPPHPAIPTRTQQQYAGPTRPPDAC